MKTYLVSLIVFLASNSLANAASEPTTCKSKENITTEYMQWKKSFQKFIINYDKLDTSEKFTTSKDSMKVVLEKMQIFSERTSIPLPESTYSHAKGLLVEVEAGRIARSIANPIMKSSLIKLEDTMDDMIAKAQWKNPACDLEAGTSRSAGL